MAQLPVLLALLCIAAGAAARAQEPPLCEADRAGIVACIAGRLCACGFERGGAMTGLEDSFRWDCGILRPSCPPDPDSQAAAAGPFMPGSIDVDVLTRRRR